MASPSWEASSALNWKFN